ncbi:MAG: class I SAM-dependent methyltransferase [Candidatus Omnitrophota bacterium]
MRSLWMASFVFFLLFPVFYWAQDAKAPSPDGAQRMRKAASSTLAPVYEPLAEWLVDKFDLIEKEGIGVDVGGGPGTLIIELAKRTKMHWINADINPNHFPFFFAAADKAGLGGRVSALFADVQHLPLRDDYADFAISRGSFPFWENKQAGFAEILRVLKPGCAAYIGRGFSENLPVETAKQVRDKQNQNGKGLKYDLNETESELRGIMKTLGIENFIIHRPKPSGSEGVNYGIWVEFRKSSANNPEK